MQDYDVGLRSVVGICYGGLDVFHHIEPFYDFAEYGSSERRKELLARWDAEVGGRAAE